MKNSELSSAAERPRHTCTCPVPTGGADFFLLLSNALYNRFVLICGIMLLHSYKCHVLCDYYNVLKRLNCCTEHITYVIGCFWGVVIPFAVRIEHESPNKSIIRCERIQRYTFIFANVTVDGRRQLVHSSHTTSTIDQCAICVASKPIHTDCQFQASSNWNHRG